MFFVFGNRGWVLRLGALAYLVNAVFALISGGWRSPFWMGWVGMALGFLTLSFAEDAAQPGSFARRSRASLVGIAATLLGGGLLVYGVLR